MSYPYCKLLRILLTMISRLQASDVENDELALAQNTPLPIETSDALGVLRDMSELLREIKGGGDVTKAATVDFASDMKMLLKAVRALRMDFNSVYKTFTVKALCYIFGIVAHINLDADKSKLGNSQDEAAHPNPGSEAPFETPPATFDMTPEKMSKEIGKLVSYVSCLGYTFDRNVTMSMKHCQRS